MIRPERFVGDEWAEWYRLTAVQRWAASQNLWQTYLAQGGRLIQNPILKVLSSMSAHRIRALFMGEQACVFCGAAEFSHDTVLAILAYAGNLARL